jgi:hypothetical protein
MKLLRICDKEIKSSMTIRMTEVFTQLRKLLQHAIL